MRCRRVTLIAATYGSTNGELETRIIAGRDPASSSAPASHLSDCLSEEGVYVIYRNRCLQIASPCEKRKCFVLHICRCAASMGSGNSNTNTHANPYIPNEFMKEVTSKGLRSRVHAWLHFPEAANAIRSSSMCFLAYPRALSRDSAGISDNSSFHFDSALDYHYSSVGSVHSYTSPPPNPTPPLAPAPLTPTPTTIANEQDEKRTAVCPPGLIELISETWRDFVESGDYRPTPTPPSTEPLSAPRRRDSIALIIEREMDTFLEITIPNPTAAVRTTGVVEDPSPSPDEGDGEGGGEEPPAPVIIPPKNMRIGRGLGKYV